MWEVKVGLSHSYIRQEEPEASLLVLYFQSHLSLRMKRLPVLWLSLVTCLMLIHIGKVMTFEMDLPPDLQHCYDTLEQTTNTTIKADNDSAHAHCLQQFLWKKDRVRWSDFNVTQKDFDVIKSLTHSFLHRTKRQAMGPMRFRRPRTGFRIRREYRRLGGYERMALHSAFVALKNIGQYDTFANLHQGIVVTSAHGGPNFFGWHRVYCALFEEALRRINPRLSLPYWDSSLDFHMESPADSVLWSSQFLGNGDGAVTSGPFANWQTPIGPLTRNVAGGSRLISKPAIRRVLSRCRTSEISEPTAQPQFNLELIHGGPHVWVGGQMSGLNTAAHDPVFFLHHAFIDYIWERFRVRQSRFCRVNPSFDYPPAPGEHAADRPMDGLPGYRNIDGYAPYWTRLWYNYERSPSCSGRFPFCGSPHLRCDIAQRRCVSRARMVTTPAGEQGPISAFGGGLNVASAARGRMQAAQLNVGPRFNAPPSEPRTQAAQVGRAAFGFPG